ncbi:MAG: permease [Candidatus Kapaibacteriota bacterium]
MEMKKELKILATFVAIFILFYFLPIGYTRFNNAIFEALELAKWYAREHVLLCLIPAFFIAGAISAFIKQDAVLKYLGSGANKFLAFGVASISGAILAVCSCTVLPLFAGIYHQGAGIGPATAFLYSGPAINVLAIILSAKVLGLEIGFARAVFAVIFSILIGLTMQILFRKSDIERLNNIPKIEHSEGKRTLWQDIVYFGTLVGILVFANWGYPGTDTGIWAAVYHNKWLLTSLSSIVLGLILIFWFKARWTSIALCTIAVIAIHLGFKNVTITFSAGVVSLIIILATGNEEMKNWLNLTWDFTKQIVPLLFVGVLVAGFLLGRPGHEAIIPNQWVSTLVGGNSIFANFFASVLGAFMYFATLTEIPIVQGLLGSGMGKGPALALLLAGPALSLPSMLVINSILGPKKTIVFILLVIIFSTLVGFVFGLT